MGTAKQERPAKDNTAGGRGGVNRQLPAQVRKRLKKHYINKYRAGKRSA